jgi:hypothetical protein
MKWKVPNDVRLSWWLQMRLGTTRGSCQGKRGSRFPRPVLGAGCWHGNSPHHSRTAPFAKTIDRLLSQGTSRCTRVKGNTTRSIAKGFDFGRDKISQTCLQYSPERCIFVSWQKMWLSSKNSRHVQPQSPVSRRSWRSVLARTEPMEKGELISRREICQSQSAVTPDGVSWCRSSSGSHVQRFVTVWQLLSCLCGAPSLTRGRVCLLPVRVCSI